MTRPRWTARPHRDGGAIIVDQDGRRVAVLSGRVAADAVRRIALAPEMLEALEWIAETAPQAYHDRPAVAVAEMARCARALLARARGDSPCPTS